MAAANRFLGANHTAAAAVHLERRRRRQRWSYGSNSGGGGGSINAIVASFARSTVSRANAAKCQGPSVASVRPDTKYSMARLHVGECILPRPDIYVIFASIGC